MLEDRTQVQCGSPDGFIAISARSGSYGSLTGMEPQSNSTAADAKIGAKLANNGEADEISGFAKDAVPPLRSTSSAKSILKANSGELDSQGSGRIKRAVSWHDEEGKTLHTVREFTPW
jgi:hypothetical protein